MTQLDNKRHLFWVDAVKAICMIMVYFAHAEIYTDYAIMPINNLFRPFYVNAFFFVSGYLLFRKQLSQPIINQPLKEWIKPSGGGAILISNVIFRLAIPSVLFAFINFFPKKMIRGETLSIAELLADTLGGCSLWFTCSLTLVEIVLFLLFFSRNNSIWLYVCVAIASAIGGVWLNKSEIAFFGMPDFPWFYKRAMLAMLYVVAGGVFYKYEVTIVKSISRWYVLSVMVIFYFFVEFLMPEKARCLTSMCEMNVLGGSVSIVGSVLLCESCKRLKEIKLFSFISKNSIIFYFFSGAIPVTLSTTLSRWMSISGLYGLLLVFILSFMAATAVSYFINRWMPVLLDARQIWKK